MKKNKKILDKVENSEYYKLRCPKCGKLLFEYKDKLDNDIIIKCSRCKMLVYPSRV